ncbi:DUF2007 domain-containing protein [Arachidicoccus soli]|uniref:DUF2007 domain-containing protein n=2 Tax=Arachidicoccus soli TaxID=2341117 RepID=A0A386HKU8_9BACT|nr:DUF2007 domain-containing protein [Arachidicoccus soli]
MKDMNNWKIVFNSSIPFEINFVKNYLASEGIETLLQNELTSQIFGNLAVNAKLLVKEEDLEQATKILIEKGYIKN